MKRLLAGVLLCLAVLSIGSTLASADLRKLDPRARLAYQGLVAGQQAAALLEGGHAVSEAGDLDVFIVGPVTRAQLEALGVQVRTALPGVCTAYLPASAVESVAALSSVQRVEGATIDEAENDLGSASTGITAQRGLGPDFTGLNGAGVIVGMVDSGADWMHQDLRHPNGTTRLLSLWDRTSSAGLPPSAVSGIPFSVGTEWTTADIDNAILGGSPVPGRDTNGHGSHVIGSAAGDGSATGGTSAPAFTYGGMAPKAGIIVGRASTTGSFSSTAIVDCASYIMQRADQLGMPCVVNISIGSQFGPKDGTHASEIAYDAMSGPGRMIVVSAGNDRGAALHAEMIAGAANNFCTMAMSGASTAARQVVLNGYYNNTENLNVTVLTPNGTLVGPVTLGGFTTVGTANGTVYVENGFALTTLGHRQVYIQVDATGTAINGTWTITVTPVTLGATNGELDLWRTSTLNTTANFVIGNTPEREIIGARATGYKTLAAAAWTTRRFYTSCTGSTSSLSGSVDPGNLSPFSSPGPTRDGRQKPEVAAPGSAIISIQTQDPAPPACAAGIMPGLLHIRNQGTSMAAPHVTGAVALIMQKYGMVDDTFVRNFIATRAVVDAFTGVAWNRDWGHGKLHLGDMTDPVATVLAPNGGEVLVVGGSTSITWNASDPYLGVTGVDILLSRDGGATFPEVLATGIANSGSYSWPAITGPTSNDCRIRVVAKDAAGNAGSDDSDQAWAIVDPPVSTVVSRAWSETVGQGVALHWEFSEAPAFRELGIERGVRGDAAVEALAADVTITGRSVSAVDLTAAPGTGYDYWLTGRDEAGARFRFGPVRGEAGGTIAHALSVAPNPSPGRTFVEFSLPRAGDVRVAVYDLMGREIALLAQGAHAAGRHTVEWTAGPSASAGLYFVRMTSPDGRLARRFAVAR